MLIACRTTSPATDAQAAASVWQVLDRRAALPHPPVSLAIPDAVALAIAGLFRSQTPSGRVLDRFYSQGLVDSNELIQAARFEQGFADVERHAALHCLIGWARSRVERQPARG